jgi:hypothetical protein
LPEVMRETLALLADGKECVGFFPTSKSPATLIKHMGVPKMGHRVVFTHPSYIQRDLFNEFVKLNQQRALQPRHTTLPSAEAADLQKFAEICSCFLKGMGDFKKSCTPDLVLKQTASMEEIESALAEFIAKLFGISPEETSSYIAGLNPDSASSAAAATEHSVDAAAASVDTVAAVDATASEPSLAAAVDTAASVDAAASEPSLAAAVDAARPFTKVKSPGEVMFAAVSFDLEEIIGFLTKQYPDIIKQWFSKIVGKNLQIAADMVKLIEFIMRDLERNAVYSKAQTYLAEMQSALKDLGCFSTTMEGAHPQISGMTQICWEAALKEILRLYKQIQKLLAPFGVMIQEPDFFWRLDLLPSLEQLLEYLLQKGNVHITLKYGAGRYSIVISDGSVIDLTQICMTQFMLQKGKQTEQHCVIAFSALPDCYIENCPGDCVTCKGGQAHVTLYTSGCPPVHAAKAVEGLCCKCVLTVVPKAFFGPTPVASSGEKQQWARKPKAPEAPEAPAAPEAAAAASSTS